MTANEAAERLDPNGEPYPEWLTQMLDEEHRATVERIRDALGDGNELADAVNTAGALRRRFLAILDEEAAR